MRALFSAAWPEVGEQHAQVRTADRSVAVDVGDGSLLAPFAQEDSDVSTVDLAVEVEVASAVELESRASDKAIRAEG